MVPVALLAEGVGRNPTVSGPHRVPGRSPSSRRAWVEIVYRVPPRASASKSPSSRRAWVEISTWRGGRESLHVALLAEGVGRNKLMPRKTMEQVQVALLAEGVGRNDPQIAGALDHKTAGRPPRGGRG